MRLGFHYHIPFYQDDQGKLRTPGYLGRFLDSLAPHCENLICFMHSLGANDIDQMDYVLQSKNIRWVNIGSHSSVPKRILYSGKYSQPVKDYRHELDALLIRGPSPLLPAMAHAAGDLPIALLLVGDYLAGIDDILQPRWRKEAIRLWSYWNYRQQLVIAKKSLTFVNSHKLYVQLEPFVQRLVETCTTTLSQNDFFEREDTCQQIPIKLLYTGRMDRAKGLFEIIESLAWLVNHGYDVTLNLVGWPQKGDTIVEELMQSALKKGIGERVIYHGFKTVGPELFAYYKQADIYVIASQGHFEGFPRTIWEAMAHSVPVVATNVGSIPYYLQQNHDAILVEPRQGEQLAHAVETLIISPTMRKAIIKQAMLTVKENTLENRSLEMYDKIVEWINR
jgi:glycosyltransferase involved in cell wall biosynthesis